MSRTVCFFGIYDPSYSRNRVLISGFKENKWNVIECRVDPKKNGGIKKYFYLWKEYKKVKNNKFDIVLVAFPGHTVVWLARILFGKKIVFDAFLSLYNSNVEDRKIYSPLSIWAIRDWSMDYISGYLSKIILMDTEAHINLFSKKFYISSKKFIRVFVSSDPKVFYPSNRILGDIFLVHFHGTFIPLQGIEYILETAKLLEEYREIKFRIIGNGQEYKKITGLAKNLNLQNVEFINSLSLENLAEKLREADISLGIFGEGEKSDCVIPNKVYEAVASKKPVITRDSKAIREIFNDGENMLLVPPSNPEAIKDKILLLYKNSDISQKIAENSYRLFEEKLAPKVLVRGLIEEVTLQLEK